MSFFKQLMKAAGAAAAVEMSMPNMDVPYVPGKVKCRSHKQQVTHKRRMRMQKASRKANRA